MIYAVSMSQKYMLTKWLLENSTWSRNCIINKASKVKAKIHI